jgi:flagellar basal-body rod protein FlgF
MEKGMYIALNGALLNESQMDMITQNLANGNSLAYKKTKMAFKDYLISPESAQEGKIMAEIAAAPTDFSNGGLTKTGNVLDLALEGHGFFALENNQYTRRGDLKRDPEGFLTTQNGLKILGPKGPIKIPEGKLEFGPNGEIMVNNTEFGKIRLVDFPENQALIRIGEDCFQTDQKSIPSKAQIKQGYLEGSNVNIFKEMTQMISTLREFQAYQKIIQSFDEMTSKMNEIARL